MSPDHTPSPSPLSSSGPAPALPVPPAQPEPTPADTAAAIAQLADAAGRASTALFNYRRNNPDATDLAQALNLEMTLDKRAIELRVQAIRLLGAQAAEAVAQMRDAAQRVDAFLHGVKTTTARLALANAVITLAGAALVGDTGGILSAVAGVHTALKAEQAATSAAA